MTAATVCCAVAGAIATYYLLKSKRKKKKPARVMPPPFSVRLYLRGAARDDLIERAGVVQVVIAITGFGKFKGVGENPTERFVKAMPFFLKANPLPPHVVVDRCIVMEVSAEGCREELDIMRSTVFQNSTDCRVYLHLGVAVGNTTFKLETTAWNGGSMCDESVNLRHCSPRNVCRDACLLT